MKRKLLQLTPLVVLIVSWECLARFSKGVSRMFSSPSAIIEELIQWLFHGDLAYHMALTAYEAALGLCLGVIVGFCIGFCLVYFPRFSSISYPYVVALSAIPTFALAPIMVIWFGTGLFMKIMMAFFSTVFITAFQTYEGAQKVSVSDQIFFDINHASRKQRFWLLSFPASMDWVIQSLKLNAGFCVLGAFIGEFIAASGGLGHMIRRATGLYDSERVFVAVLGLVLITAILTLIASIINDNKLKIIRFVTRIAFRKGNSKG